MSLVISRPSLFVFALLLGGLDVVAVAVLQRVPAAAGARTDSGSAASEARPDDGSAVPLVSGWALCQTQFAGAPVEPASVAVSYLDTQIDLHVLPNEIKRWFGTLPPSVVDVYKLETDRGVRRVAFEIQRGKWARWDEVAAGLEGKDVCSAVRAALLDAGVGRPRPANVIAEPEPTDDPDATADEPADAVSAQRSRYDFEFIYARRRQLYRQIEWIGSLDHALELDNFVELRQWLHSRL